MVLIAVLNMERKYVTDRYNTTDLLQCTSLMDRVQSL